MSQSNSDIELNYYLWAEYGNPGFIITNNTDKIAYVDLTKSFFTINGISKDCYLNREWSTTNSVGLSASATLYGYLYHNGVKYKGNVSESVYGSQSKGVTQKEKDIIAIPPTHIKNRSRIQHREQRSQQLHAKYNSGKRSGSNLH